MRSALVSLMVLVGCAKGAAPGAERGPCKSDHTCEGSLVCLSDLCVRPPAGDCAQVAEALASVTLGNYAPKDKRASTVADLRARCAAEGISVDDAMCLTKAQSKFEMSKCPHPLLPELVELAKDKGGCKAVGARMADMAKVEMAKDPNDPMAKVMPQLLEAVVASCDEDGWPDDVKGCMLAADAKDDRAANVCIEKMPKAVQEKFMKRIETIVEGVTRAGAPPSTPPPAMPPATAP